MFVDIYNTDKKYVVIYADPCWEYNKNNNAKLLAGAKCRGTGVLPYPTMSTDEICNLPVKSLAATRSILFIWATFPKLQECLRVIDAWGFSYTSLGFDWTKLNKKNGKPFIGMGFYTRQNNEICLIGTRKEKIKVYDHTISCVVQSVRREHSRKPDEVRNYIDAICGDVPKIELFARQSFPGWDCWGNQTDLFNAPTSVQPINSISPNNAIGADKHTGDDDTDGAVEASEASDTEKAKGVA